MRKTLIVLALFAIGHGVLAQERWTEPIPYGDMDQWQVRYIHESKLLGGKTKTLYALRPTPVALSNTRSFGTPPM